MTCQYRVQRILARGQIAGQGDIQGAAACLYLRVFQRIQAVVVDACQRQGERAVRSNNDGKRQRFINVKRVVLNGDIANLRSDFADGQRTQYGLIASLQAQGVFACWQRLALCVQAVIG